MGLQQQIKCRFVGPKQKSTIQIAASVRKKCFKHLSACVLYFLTSSSLEVVELFKLHFIIYDYIITFFTRIVLCKLYENHLRKITH